MHVLLNSDVIFSKSLRRTGLPAHVQRFLEKCAAAGHKIIVPETTKLEFDKAQQVARHKEMLKLQEAISTVETYGIHLPKIDTDAQIPLLPLEDLLEKVPRLNFSIEIATLEDYHGALRKASYKEIPHPPTSDMDEMRDLVIWQTALRIARDCKGAILVSRDEVHTHHRGDVEANGNGLLRARDFEAAEEILKLETTSAALIKKLLKTQWQSVLDIGLPIVDGAAIVSIKSAEFVETSIGTTLVACDLTLSTGAGKTIQCGARLEFVDDTLYGVDITHGKAKYHKEFELEPHSDYAERLADLLDTIGDDDGS